MTLSLNCRLNFFPHPEKTRTHTHAEINASLVFLHAFNSLVCWCWFTFGTLSFFILLSVVVIFSWISHWFCSMPLHVHTNESVVLIVLLSMSQRAPNPNIWRTVFSSEKHWQPYHHHSALARFGSDARVLMLVLVLVLQALDCSNISLTRAAFISQLFDHFEISITIDGFSNPIHKSPNRFMQWL